MNDRVTAMARAESPASTGPDTAGCDIAGCDREPIHSPGSIQPHGRLLVLSDGPAPTLLAADRLTWGAAQGASGRADAPMLGGLLRPADAARVAAAMRDKAGGDPYSASLPGLATWDGGEWDGILHAAGGSSTVLLELEPRYADQIVPRDLLARLNRALTGIQRARGDQDACAAAAAAVQAISGFDRVMTYRFASDWAGEVVAEARDPGTAGSYLGLHFPASDIPAQARALYARNPVRLIPDAGYAPLPLSPDRHGAGDPLDLSDAILRSVSPVHLRYLANMGVRASMSVSVLRRDGTLWGLIACHHLRSPRFVGHDAREACLLLGRALSWRLSELEDEAVAARTMRVGALRADMMRELEDTSEPVGIATGGHAADALACVGADGLAICRPSDGAPALFGTASGGLAEAVCAWLDRSRPGGTAATDRLPAEFPLAAPDTAAASGLLATPLPAGDGWILWFRPELRRTVSWAGNPEKPVVPGGPDGPAGLSPRHSFAAWEEEVRGRSLPWASADIAAAEALRDTVADVLTRRTVRLERENRRLAERNEELGLFADAASHDLKEPLWQVEVFCGLLKEDLGNNSDQAEMAEMASAIAESAARMRVMIDDLASYARAGRRSGQLVRMRLDELAREAMRDLAERLRAAGCTAPQFTGQWETAILCDRVQIYRVFQNLLSNAVKYRSPERPLHLHLSAAREEAAGPARLRVAVEDNGLGFDQRYAETVFEPFRRLAVEGAEPSDGTGLGLALCRRIVTAHGGGMGVTAMPGRGARFWFTLPIAGLAVQEVSGP